MGRKRRKGSVPRRGRSVACPTHVGTVRAIGPTGTVETPEGAFALSRHALREAMPGDTVSVSVRRVRGGERRAFIDRVVEHATTSVVGIYAEAGPLGVVTPIDTRIKQDFFVLPDDASTRRLGVRPGDAVRARIVVYPTIHEAGVVTVERRLGEKDGIDLGIQCVMARFDLTEDYPGPALEEAQGLALDIDAALREPLRRDVRDRFALTIDPADARDFDDAISVERTDSGGYRLGVHIADVSAYVPWDSHVDLAARERSTSVYLADRVIPMLPEKLCCDLCSLRPGEDRLAMTVDMELDRAGEVVAYEAYPSVMRSRCRLAYDEADSLLSGEVADREVAGVSLRSFLACADGLARLRVARRARRGAIDFDTVEVRAVLNDAGAPVAISPRARTSATGLVEEAMLLANECVAEFLTRADVTTAYRVHDAPAPENLSQAAGVLLDARVVGQEEAAGIRAGDRGAMQRVLEEAKGGPDGLLVSAVLLRAMQRAVYKPVNEGHYALGAEAYCHFTSPIRRYPDLLVHRCLKQRLLRRELGRARARALETSLVGTGETGLAVTLPLICRHASEKERSADAAAHASQKVKIAQYFSERVGERYLGTVSWVDRMGVFVRMDETMAEGLVRLRDLGGSEWWEYDEDRMRMLGTATGRTVELGQRVVVEVKSASPLRGHVDLALVRELRPAR